MAIRTGARPRSTPALLVGLGLLAGGLVPLSGAGAEGGTSVPSVVIPLDPRRILDTRTALGIGTTSPLTPDQTITLQVTGAGGVPAGATGVVLNVTVNSPTGAGYVSAYPAGATRPEASVINYSAGEDVANMITATLSPSGAIDLYNAQASAHLIADVAGYLAPGTGGGSGPQGPQGPQGPAGTPAEPGLGINQTMQVGTPALTVGTIDSVNIVLSCVADNGGTARVAFSLGVAGTVKVAGTEFDAASAAFGNPPNTSAVNTSITGGAGSAVGFGDNNSRKTISGTLIGPNGGFNQFEVFLDRIGTTCLYTGSITPV